MGRMNWVQAVRATPIRPIYFNFYKLVGTGFMTYGEQSLATGERIQVGSVQVGFIINLKGPWVQISQSSSVVTGPPINVDLQWQCFVLPYNNSCGEDSESQSFFAKHFSWPSPPSGVGPRLKAGGRYTIHLNWNFSSAGERNDRTLDGRFYWPAYVSLPISCYKTTVSCKFDPVMPK